MTIDELRRFIAREVVDLGLDRPRTRPMIGDGSKRE
jgi:hypothetical protein